MVYNWTSLGLLFAPDLEIVKEICQEVFVLLQKPVSGVQEPTKHSPQGMTWRGNKINNLLLHCRENKKRPLQARNLIMGRLLPSVNTNRNSFDMRLLTVKTVISTLSY